MTEELELTEKKEESLAKLDNFSNAQEMLEFAKVLIRSGLVPSGLNTPEKVVTTILQGRELGFGAVTSLGCINNIQGKATLSVHAIAALLKKSGIVYKLLADFETTKKPDGSLDLAEDGKPKDKITTIRFYQKFGNQVIENDISYRWSEAVNAGLTSKDNWKKMARIMMRARALAIGARFVAPDAMLGMYETSEIADVKNVDYKIDDEGEVTIIK